ncbi:hypothetical protein EYF80_066329 [Liparis tanakae]|uniref:Uncharacterized protein n=1 Tax=Liparis tanakae TaxID=230148 RepID=A0A4Z2E470_9TELE|nr:hypothetical protein EYF80_066329 [Liparis tanakae]
MYACLQASEPERPAEELLMSACRQALAVECSYRSVCASVLPLVSGVDIAVVLRCRTSEQRWLCGRLTLSRLSGPPVGWQAVRLTVRPLWQSEIRSEHERGRLSCSATSTYPD